MTDVIIVGSFVQDLAFRTETFPAPGETRIGVFRTGPGGKGFNQAIACSRLGPHTSFIGASGADGFARDVQEFLRDEALQTRFQTVEDQPTGAASIVVNQSGQNLIVVALGANDCLSPLFVKAQTDLFETAKIVVAQLESNLEAAHAAFEMGRKYGARLILNPAPINNKIDRELVELADILVPNETEAAFLMTHLYGIKVSKPLTESSDEELTVVARKLSPKTVIITLGAHGSFVAPPEVQPFRVAPIAVNAIDTTGAGDAFNGGLAAGLIEFPQSLERAVQFATVAAGLSTEKEGTAQAMPIRQEVNSRCNFL